MLRRIVFHNFLEDEDEKILFVFRRPFVLTYHKLIFRILIWGTIAGVVLWYDYDWQYYQLVEIIVTCIAGLKILGPLAGWYANAIVMTTEGLVFVQWPKFFHRSYERIDFVNLDEIAVNRVGLRAFTLNYGTVTFQKSNGGIPITWQRMSKPQRLARRVEHYQEIMLNQKNFTEESALKDLLSQLVQTHVDDSGQPDRLTDSGYKRKEKRLFGRKTVPDRPKKNRKGEPADDNQFTDQLESSDTDSGETEHFSMHREDSADAGLLEKLKKLQELESVDVEEDIIIEEEVKTPKVRKKRKIRKRIVDGDEYIDIEVEKELDNSGGLGIDLDE